MAKVKAKDVKVYYGGSAVSDQKSVNFTLKQNMDDERVKSDGNGPHHDPTYVDFSGSVTMGRNYGSWGTMQDNQLAGTKAQIDIYVSTTKLVGALCLIESSSVTAPVDGKVEVTVNFKAVGPVTVPTVQNS